MIVNTTLLLKHKKYEQKEHHPLGTSQSHNGWLNKNYCNHSV